MVYTYTLLYTHIYIYMGRKRLSDDHVQHCSVMGFRGFRYNTCDSNAPESIITNLHWAFFES